MAGAFTLVSVIAVTAQPVGAQDPAPGPSWLRAASTNGPVAATLALDHRGMLWSIDGALPLDFSSNVRTGPAGRPALGLGLAISGAPDARDPRYTALVDRHGSRTGGWLGVSNGGTPARLDLGAGFWRSFAPIEFEAGVVSSEIPITERQESHWGFARDSLHWRDTTTYSVVHRTVQRTTAQTAVRWHHGRLDLSAIGGLTFGDHTETLRWAQANMQLQVSQRVLVLAALGWRPEAALAFDQSARPNMMIGVQVAPWAAHEWALSRSIVPRATEWVAKPLDTGRTVIHVRCRNASRVELAGDFTEWAPVPLTAMGGDRWETILTLAPGLHQVQIRIDGGAWQVPPGLPTTQGEFAGAVGVLLIE